MPNETQYVGVGAHRCAGVTMSRILVQTTIAEHPDDWDIARFSMLVAELRAAGHDVTARNRAGHSVDDPVMSSLDELDYDQLWLMAVDVGDGLTDAEVAAIIRFRRNGGGVLTARDHQDLGSCLLALGSLGGVNHFRERNPDPGAERDDQDTPTISWPNYHSGANGDYQPVFADEPVHELLRTAQNPAGRIEWFPAHPHEGAVSACVPHARVVARGRSAASGRAFSLAVALDGEAGPDGRPMGRALAESTFHHFADYNWDVDRGAPSFVSEPAGGEIKADPSAGGLQGLHPQHRDLVAPGEQTRRCGGNDRSGGRLTRTATMRAMKVGVQIHPQNTTMAALRAGWQGVDDLGVDSLWTWDHFFSHRCTAPPTSHTSRGGRSWRRWRSPRRTFPRSACW